MAFNDSVSVEATPNGCDMLVFSWYAEYDEATNASTIDWDMRLVSNDAGEINGVPVERDWRVVIDGQEFTGTADINISNNQTKTLASGQIVLEHAEDGTRSFSFEFSQAFYITWGDTTEIGVISGSGTGELDAIVDSEPELEKFDIQGLVMGLVMALGGQVVRWSKKEFTLFHYGPTPPVSTEGYWMGCMEPETVEIVQNELPVPAWEAAPEMAKYCSQCATATYDGKQYRFGGHYYTSEDGKDFNFSDRIRVFDPKTQTHTLLPNLLPYKLYRMVAVVVGDKIWLIGGRNNNEKAVDYIWVFDPTTGIVVDTEVRMPSARYTTAAAVGNTIYILGGADGKTCYADILALDTVTLELRVLDAKLPYQCWGASAAAVGDKIYCFGGISYPNSANTCHDTVVRFDPIAETVELLPCRLNHPLVMPSTTVVGDKIWIIGGYTWPASGNNFRNNVEVFNPEAESFASGPNFPDASFGHAVSELNGAVYVFGGRSEARTGLYDTSFKHGFKLDLSIASPGTLQVQAQVDDAGEVTDVMAASLGDSTGLWSPVTVRVWKDGAWTEIVEQNVSNS